MLPKLYVVTRADLAPGARAAQLTHGAIQFWVDHPELARRWFEESNVIVLLEVPDELALEGLSVAAAAAGVASSRFIEPDLRDSLTAVAVHPTGAQMLARLPLAFSPGLATTPM